MRRDDSDDTPLQARMNVVQNNTGMTCTNILTNGRKLLHLKLKKPDFHSCQNQQWEKTEETLIRKRPLLPTCRGCKGCV
jgi:hypothetical protein